MIGSACETAEKVIADCRKSYGLGSRQGTNLVPTLDKAQAAKIQEQEGLLRAAVNYGEGERQCFTNVDKKYNLIPKINDPFTSIFDTVEYLALLKLFDCQDYGYQETRGSHNLFQAI